MQNRVKRCRIKKKCGTTVFRVFSFSNSHLIYILFISKVINIVGFNQQEERSCYHKRKGRRRMCSQRGRRRNNRVTEPFHVIQVSIEIKKTNSTSH